MNKKENFGKIGDKIGVGFKLFKDLLAKEREKGRKEVMQETMELHDKLQEPLGDYLDENQLTELYERFGAKVAIIAQKYLLKEETKKEKKTGTLSSIWGIDVFITVENNVCVTHKVDRDTGVTGIGVTEEEAISDFCKKWMVYINFDRNQIK